MVRQDCVEDILGRPIEQDELDAKGGPFLAIMIEDDAIRAYEKLKELI